MFQIYRALNTFYKLIYSTTRHLQTRHICV